MILITRTTQFSNKFVPIQIHIDGQQSGSLVDGERSEFRIPSGEHTIQAKLNISTSNILEFTISDNQIIEFELGSTVNVVKNILIALSHPALLVVLYMLDKIIGWDYFLLTGLIAFLGFEAWMYIARRRKKTSNPEAEKHYLYLKRVNRNL